MLDLLRQHPARITQPFQRYILLWIAFNNIYTTLSEISGRKPKLIIREDGSIRTRSYGNVEIPVVTKITEKDQLDIVHKYFNETVRHLLITHDSTKYFVYRTPIWNNNNVVRDKRGQTLNGVLNVGQTISDRDPVWSPICTIKYVNYMNGRHSHEDRSILSYQVLHLLYTIRNNIFHGGKRADDSNAVEVVERAIPLLTMIVDSFLEGRGLTTG
jgi:hypothetical protein